MLAHLWTRLIAVRLFDRTWLRNYVKFRRGARSTVALIESANETCITNGLAYLEIVLHLAAARGDSTNFLVHLRWRLDDCLIDCSLT